MTGTDRSHLFEHLQEFCLFCAPGRHRQDDQIILRSDSLYLFAGLGAIQEGYIIIAPYQCGDSHHPLRSLAELSAAEADELVFLRGLVSIFYRERFGQPGMSFEHGRAGTCLSIVGGTRHCYHGHLCCYPYSVPLLDSDKLKDFLPIEVDRYSGLGTAAAGAPYLFVENCNVDERFPADHLNREIWKAVVVPLTREDELESQLLRKLLAKRVDKPDLWDWRQYPAVDAALKLVCEFHQWLRSPEQMYRFAINWNAGVPRIDYVRSIVRCNRAGNDYVARKYEEKWGDRVQHGALGRFLRQFPDNQPGRIRVLDAGCGPGTYTRALSAAGLSALGTDLSGEMLGFARQRSWGAPMDIGTSAAAGWVQSDVLAPCFMDASFDGIWFSAVWVHVPRPAALGLLGRLRQLLKPGGVMYLSARTGSGSVFTREGRVFFLYTDAEMQGLFRANGLEVLETWTGEVDADNCGNTRLEYWRHYLIKASSSPPSLTTDSRALAALGEREIVRQIQSWLELNPRNRSLVLGAGDDAAVMALHPGMAVVATSDHCPTPVISMLGDTDPWYRGWYSMVISLSDLAAMGARPLGMLLAVEAPREMTLKELGRFYDGVLEASREFECPVIGGNLREGPILSCVSTALGEAAPNRLLTRGMARPGDSIAVIGDMGLFLAGVLARIHAIPIAPANRLHLDRNLKRPHPRIREGRLIAERGLSLCAIDSSDGLIASFQELAQSGAGIDLHVDITSTDVHPAVLAVADQTAFDVRKLLLSWGDWQLVSTCSPGRFAALAEAVSTLNCPVHKLGWVSEGTGKVWYHDESGTGLLAGLPNERFTPGSYFSHDLNSYLALLRRTPLVNASTRGGEIR
jgi:thiamine-monophosphate kinase